MVGPTKHNHSYSYQTKEIERLMAGTKLLPENDWCKWKMGENIFAEITTRCQLSVMKEITEVSKTPSKV